MHPDFPQGSGEVELGVDIYEGDRGQAGERVQRRKSGGCIHFTGRGVEAGGDGRGIDGKVDGRERQPRGMVATHGDPFSITK